MKRLTWPGSTALMRGSTLTCAPRRPGRIEAAGAQVVRQSAPASTRLERRAARRLKGSVKWITHGLTQTVASRFALMSCVNRADHHVTLTHRAQRGDGCSD